MSSARDGSGVFSDAICADIYLFLQFLVIVQLELIDKERKPGFRRKSTHTYMHPRSRLIRCSEVAAEPASGIKPQPQRNQARYSAAAIFTIYPSPFSSLINLTMKPFYIYSVQFFLTVQPANRLVVNLASPAFTPSIFAKSHAPSYCPVASFCPLWLCKHSLDRALSRAVPVKLNY